MLNNYAYSQIYLSYLIFSQSTKSLWLGIEDFFLPLLLSFGSVNPWQIAPLALSPELTVSHLLPVCFLIDIIVIRWATLDLAFSGL